MTKPTLTGQDEARRALADRLLTISEGDLREYARDSLVGIHPDQTELRRWADLMDEAAELLRAPSLDRGAEEMRELAAKVCEVEAAACLGDIAHAVARFPDMSPDERGDRLAHARASSLLDAAGDIRALQIQGGSERG